MQWRPQIVGNYDLNSTENIRNILLHNLLNTIAGALWNKLFKLDLIRRNNLSFCEDIVHSEDALFVMSYFLKTNSVSLNEHTFYYYVRREGQATGTIRAKKFIQNIILVHQELQLYIQNEDLNYENDFSILFLRNLYDAIQDYWNILLIQNRRIYSLNSIRKNIKASITDWNWFCYTIKAALESCDPQYSHCNLLELKFLKYIIDGNYKHISLYHRIVLMLRLEKFKGMISRHGIIHVIRKLLFIKR